MTLEKKQEEFRQIVGDKLVSLVLFSVSHNAADTLDRIHRDVAIIQSTAETYFSATKA